MAAITTNVELYGMRSCPYTAELREHLLWNDVMFTEFDVEADEAARTRLVALVGRHPQVPALVEDGRVTQLGWRGHCCVCP